MAIRRKISEVDGAAAVHTVKKVFEADQSVEAFKTLPRTVRATAVRYMLEELATLAPGNSVEVRVPPLGVTQCVAGPRHTRGTPPNVVEMDAFTWVSLCLGKSFWSDEIENISASGLRSDLSQYLPLAL